VLIKKSKQHNTLVSLFYLSMFENITPVDDTYSEFQAHAHANITGRRGLSVLIAEYICILLYLVFIVLIINSQQVSIFMKQPDPTTKPAIDCCIQLYYTITCLSYLPPPKVLGNNVNPFVKSCIVDVLDSVNEAYIQLAPNNTSFGVL